MASNRSNPQYFTYQEYDAVKKSLVYEPKETIDVSFANHLINSIHNTPKKEEKLRETFCELKKLVQRDYCFYYHGDNCCNYINYWLNKTVRKSEYNVNDENFNIFDKFMKIDPKAKEDKINCTSKLSYIDTDAFEKIKKLYDLYDYFTELKESKNRSSLCHNISKLSEKYESIWQECKGKDDYLCNKLRNLKRVIENDELVVNDMCTRNNFESFILKIDPPPPKEQNPPKNVQVPVQSRNSGETPPPTPVSDYSARVHGRKPGEKPPPTPVSGYSAQVQRRKSVETSTPPPVRVSSSPVQGLEKPARGESERISPVPSAQFPLELTALSALPPLPLLQLGQLKPLEQLETSEPTGPKGPFGVSEPESVLRQEQPQEQEGYQPQHDVHHLSEDEADISLEEGDQSAGSIFSTFNPETIMEKMKIAVSKFLETVEPVPILGVSGGMGALYLLFKYTPTGSLFRRNRRNNQNIPNFFDPRYGEQFSGYYPQYYNEGFPNYRMNIAYHPSSEELD
ncbi:VIR protein [Plasmodium vivax]|uniref:VIR protein n=1 Tax=Plasmodium vivax TaxID=5855 RepID=A0A1G4E7P2_PLAVI|nr:VIR protein [Plasmodium vivax]